MRVSVLGFGCVWRRRLGKDPGDPKRFARAAYYNTTGIAVGGKLGPGRGSWATCGSTAWAGSIPTTRRG